MVYQADQQRAQCGGCASEEGGVEDGPLIVRGATACWGLTHGCYDGGDCVGEEDAHDDQEEGQAEEACALGYGEIDAGDDGGEVKLSCRAEAHAESRVAPDDVEGVAILGKAHEAGLVLEAEAGC